MARKYKDSGIEWIGQIPKEWKIYRLKGMAHSLSKGNGITKEEVFPDGDTPCVRYGEIYSKYNGAFVECVSRTRKDNLLTTHYFDYGDILFAGTGELVEEIGKNIVYIGKTPCLAGGDIIILKHSQNPVFLNYALNSQYAQCQKSCGKAKLKVVHISSSEIGDMQVILPPLPEQQKIADYLDKVCGEADEMIALQEKMIEELKAYKQSIITEAVTKGLNPNVPMKNSSIDWIGEIPEHWRLEPLKYCFGRRSEKNYPVKTEERLSLSIDKGVTLYAEKTTNLDRFKDDFTQYQIAYPNDIVLNCMNMIVGAVGLSNYMGCVSPVYYVIYPSKQDVNPLYYSYLLNIPTIRGVYYSLGKGIYAIERGEGRVNTCRLKVSYNDFGRLEIPVPPVEEQKAITQYIQEKCSEIDSMIAIKQQKIAELKEYKKSVIYEYVTGKKEVV